MNRAKMVPTRKKQQNYERLDIGTLFVHETPCFPDETPFLLTGLMLTARFSFFQTEEALLRAKYVLQVSYNIYHPIFNLTHKFLI